MTPDYKYKYIKYKLKYLSVSEKLKNLEIKDNNIKTEFQYVKPCSGGCYLLDW